LWGSATACRVTYPKSDESQCGLKWEAIGGVQTYLLDADAQAALA